MFPNLHEQAISLVAIASAVGVSLQITLLPFILLELLTLTTSTLIFCEGHPMLYGWLTVLLFFSLVSGFL